VSVPVGRDWKEAAGVVTVLSHHPRVWTGPTLLRIGNLDVNVTLQDIQELFDGRKHALESTTLADDSYGDIHGTSYAFVSYRETLSAKTAYNQYNDALLDGKRLQISFISEGFDHSEQRPHPPR
jgi:RNA recognition motif-containing protein